MIPECDIAVVGAGIAGLSAGLRGRELGATVLVFEQSEEELYPCNSRMTGGVFHVAFNSIEAPPEQLKAAIMAATFGAADPRLAELMGREIAPSIQWLRGQGAHFIRTQAQPYYSAILAPPGLRRAGVHWRGFGGDRLMRNLASRLEAAGALRRGVRIAGVERRGTGYYLTGERPSGEKVEITASAVIFADGGFAGDEELVRRHISARPEALCRRGAGTGVGAGVKIGGALGAQLKDLNRFYGHVQARRALGDEGLWPYPVVDHVATATVVVNRQGRRFLDEGRGGVYIANEIAAAADPLGAFVICDEPGWQGPGRAHRLPPNPSLPRANGEIYVADNLMTLAGKAGICAQGLVATIEDHNRMVESGEAPAFVRTTDRYRPWPIRSGPFYAIPVVAGLTYTMGGLVVDDCARVLDRTEAPIDGLFAAGATTAGLEGGPFAGYTGGLSKSLVLGLRAAETAARLTAQVRGSR